jgi:hypothetical protein
MIKLLNILSEAEVAKCPAPTQNIELNLKNRQKDGYLISKINLSLILL